MINVNIVPCIECKFYGSVVQPDGSEQTEYIRCEKAEDKNANSLLKVSDGKTNCSEFVEMNNDGS